jgi:hypothetical protein
MKKIIEKLLESPPCTGLVTNNEVRKESYPEIGEMLDVLQVAAGKKPLAALNFSKQKIKGNKEQIEIMKYANEKGVKYITQPKIRSKNYLRSVFYLPETKDSKKRAVALLTLLHLPVPEKISKYMDAGIGLLLGYNKNNIIAFYERNFEKNMHLTKTLLEKYEKTLEAWINRNIDPNSHVFKEYNSINVNNFKPKPTL